jgi:hypothetical protein
MEKDDNTYSLLNVWNLTEFSSIVYLKYNSLVIHSTYQIFDHVLPYNNEPPISEFVTVSRVTNDNFRVDFKTDFFIIKPLGETFNMLLTSLSTFKNGSNFSDTKYYPSLLETEHMSPDIGYDPEKGNSSLNIGVTWFLNIHFGRSRLTLPFIFALDNIMEYGEPRNFQMFQTLFPNAISLHYNGCKPYNSNCNTGLASAAVWETYYLEAMALASVCGI